MRSINAYTLAALGASTAYALPASQRNTVSTNSHWGVGNGFTNGDALNKRNSVIDLDPNNPALRPIDPPFEVLCPEVCRPDPWCDPDPDSPYNGCPVHCSKGPWCDSGPSAPIVWPPLEQIVAIDPLGPDEKGRQAAESFEKRQAQSDSNVSEGKNDNARPLRRRSPTLEYPDEMETEDADWGAAASGGWGGSEDGTGGDWGGSDDGGGDCGGSDGSAGSNGGWEDGPDPSGPVPEPAPPSNPFNALPASEQSTEGGVTTTKTEWHEEGSVTFWTGSEWTADGKSLKPTESTAGVDVHF